MTKNRITVVAVVHNDEQLKSDPVAPKTRSNKSLGTYQDAIYDYLPNMRFYETWGRDIERSRSWSASISYPSGRACATSPR